MNQYQQTSFSFNFKPRARLLVLLGDQLIRDPGIAVFELVKNAYDADSPFCRITMLNVSDPVVGRIIIEDEGTGMDQETIRDVWLVPGTDTRILQRKAGIRTQKYKRIPMGEKGVGRFAVHKLGNQIKLITRKKGDAEIEVNINWSDFDTAQPLFMDEIPVTINVRAPTIFRGDKSGTRIEITDLRNAWDRRMLRELFRSVNSICSPFNEKKEAVGKKESKLQNIENEDFYAELILKNPIENSWVKDLLTVDKILEFALFHATGEISGNKMTMKYKFTPFTGMDRVKGREEYWDLKKPLTLPGIEENEIETIRKKIGDIHLDLYIFDRDPSILRLGVTDRKGLRDFLNENGGVRVYRDGIRVYDYGEPGNDWLKLSEKRVNIPTKRLSNNLIIGAVSLHLEDSINLSSAQVSGLIEKTNREGFVDNDAYQAFRKVVEAAIDQVAVERNKDKKRIRDAYSSGKLKEPVLDTIYELREVIEKKHLTEDLGPFLTRIELDFIAIRDRLLTGATAGLSLSIVIHEVEKGIAELVKAVEIEQSSPHVIALVKHIADLTEGYGALIRQSGVTREKATGLIKQALFNTEYRLNAHNVKLITDFSQGDFTIKCSRRLVISTLMNLIDNSLYWLEVKHGKQKSKKAIYIGLSREIAGGPAIIVADNGTGFIDPPEFLIEPFISRKPDGMGLGLHLASEVMRAQGGMLDFPLYGDLKISENIDGATVALIFKE